jgi:hypothetical protein
LSPLIVGGWPTYHLPEFDINESTLNSYYPYDILYFQDEL